VTIFFVGNFPIDLNVPADDAYRAGIPESPVFLHSRAAMRIRCLVPLGIVGRHRRAMLSSLTWIAARASQLSADDTLVLFKLGSGEIEEKPALADALRRLMATPARIVYDTCDPLHLAPDTLAGQLQAELARRADLVTCPTAALLQSLSGITRQPIRLVPDTVDLQPRRSEFAPAERLRLIWFGWLTKPRLNELDQQLRRIGAALGNRPIDCALLCQPVSAGMIARINDEHAAARTGIVVHHSLWALPQAWDSIAVADIALIPHDAGGIDAMKSHNRLSTAILAGTFAVANPIPQYRPFAAHSWLGDNLADGVAWTLDHPDQALRRIEAGQQAVMTLYGPEAVGAAWIEALASLGPAG
jgi:hypothetical protein